MKTPTDEQITLASLKLVEQGDTINIVDFEKGAKWCREQQDLAGEEKSMKQIIEMSVGALKHIMEICDRLNTGNVSHDRNTIKGRANRMIGFIEDRFSQPPKQIR